VVLAFSACGGTAKSYSTAASPAAPPITPAPVAPDPATTPPAEPTTPEPARPDQVAVAEDPDAGGEIAEDPDAGGEVAEGKMGKKDGGGAGMGSTSLGGGGSHGRAPAGIQIRWGAPTILGGMDKAIVRRVFRVRQKELEACYRMILMKKPGAGGLLVLKLRIEMDGKVSASTASGVSDALETCVSARVKTWVFPRPPSGAVSVTQPVTFSPR
jgi:hypothetical protein